MLLIDYDGWRLFLERTPHRAIYLKNQTRVLHKTLSLILRNPFLRNLSLKTLKLSHPNLKWRPNPASSPSLTTLW